MPHGAVPFPFGQCRICNDKATGFHYGVPTCEGCKGFFKRSIPRGDQYTCFFGGHCSITPFNRNRCKACRFQRCRENGMAIDAVKMGRIPKMEKERALLEAGLEANPEGDSHTDTNTSISHCDWMESDLDNPPHCREMHDDPVCEGSRRLNMLASQFPQDEVLSARIQTYPMLEWKSELEDRSSGMSLEQIGCNSGDTSLYRRERSLLRQPQTLGAPTGNIYKDTLIEKASSSREICTHSSLALSSSSSVCYESTTMKSLSNTGDLIVSSFNNQIITEPENNHQENDDFSNKNLSVMHSQFLGCSDIKTEPVVAEFNSVANMETVHCANSALNKETVHCANPFAQTSVSTCCHGKKSYGDSCSLHDTKVFDSTEMPFSVEGVDETSMEIVRCGLQRESNVAQHEHSIESIGYIKSKPGKADIGTINREDNANLNRNICRNSCYSPDVINVLMDQVGQTRMEAMKQQIMSTIANNFGPDDCQATAQLLTSYTTSSKQVQDIKPDFVQKTDTREQENVSTVPECSESFIHRLHGEGSFEQLNPQGLPDLASGRALFHTTHYGSNDTLESSLPRVQTQQSNDTPAMSSAFPGFKSEHSSKLPHLFNEQPQPGLFACTKRTRINLSNVFSFPHYSSTTVEEKHFEFPGAHRYCEHDAMDTAGDCSTTNIYPTVMLNEQCLAEECDTGVVRSSDKVSISSNSHNSSSEKDISSPDSSNIDDLTMEESALTLRAAYDKHMTEIARKHRIMMDYIQNEKIIPIHPLTLEGKGKVYENLISSIPRINKCIIGFSQDVPGFVSLPKEDKELLMKRGYYDIWMLTNSKLFYKDESYLQFSDGTFYTRAWMETILNEAIAQKFIAFAKKFNSLALSDLETAILCAIQLTSASNEQLDLKSRETIEHMNSHFVDLLVHEVSKQHPNTCSRVLVDIFRLMPDLAEINMMQQEIIANFSAFEPPTNVVYKAKEVPLVDLMTDSDLEALVDN